MNLFYRCAVAIVGNLFRLLYPMHFIGRENIPASPFLICANHSAFSDPFFVAVGFTPRRDLRFMAKTELMELPVLGPILHWLGVFGVERGKSDLSAVKTALRCLKNGENVAIFPQGTRYKTKAQSGAALLALRAGVPVVPVFVPVNKRFFRRNTVVIGAAYRPQAPEGLGRAEGYQAAADEIMSRVWALGGIEPTAKRRRT
ncbi:MAG TPA: lysophospholipid acyltransferase family protein [Oscillospiraceae bacterium]|nr:lysophospholipid acyltransferase family protein [Oscillospiraceae bacterium]